MKSQKDRQSETVGNEDVQRRDYECPNEATAVRTAERRTAGTRQVVKEPGSAQTMQMVKTSDDCKE